MEGNITKTQCRHYCERPIHSRHPRMFLTLKQHDVMKGNAESDYQEKESREETRQSLKLDAARSIFVEAQKLSNEEFHESVSMARAAGIR